MPLFTRRGNCCNSAALSSPKGTEAHSFLWLRLSNCGHAPLQRVGGDISYLRTARNEADYNLGAVLHQSIANNHVQLALLEQAAAMPATLTQITDAMKIYERDVLKEVTWRA